MKRTSLVALCVFTTFCLAVAVFGTFNPMTTRAEGHHLATAVESQKTADRFAQGPSFGDWPTPEIVGLCTLAANIEVESSGGTAIAGYTTLGAAFTAINAETHTGVIVIEVCGNTTETATASLDSGAIAPASYSEILMRPVGSARTIEGSIVGAVVKLNGADNVTIDGRISGIGNSRDLTIRNNSTSAATAAVWLSSVVAGNGATNDTIQNVEISAGTDSTSSGTNASFGIIMSGAAISVTSNGTDNDNNQFLSNRVIKARYGIVTRGTTSNLNIAPVISNNLIGAENFGSEQIGKVGIFVQADSGGVISDNIVQNVGCLEPQACTGADRMGIAVGNNAWGTSPGTITSNTYTVVRNTIRNIIDENQFSAVGINLATTGGGLSTNNFVANNFIYNVRANAQITRQTVGIGIAGGHTDSVVFNSIALYGDVDPGATLAPTTHGSGIRIANPNGTTHANLTLKNNSIYMDLSSSGTPELHFYAISGSASSYSFGTGGQSNNNYYLNPSNPQLRTGGLGTGGGSSLMTEFASLANWQGAYTAAQDADSLQADPQYVSLTDLHFQSGSPNVGAGSPISGITEDIDSDLRDPATPDIGADEFVAPGMPGTVQFSSASYSGLENSGTITVTATRTGGSGGPASVNYGVSSLAVARAISNQKSVRVPKGFRENSLPMSWITKIGEFSSPIFRSSPTEAETKGIRENALPNGRATDTADNVLHVPPSVVIPELGIPGATGGASCTAGVDYITPSGTLNWANGDSADKTFDIMLCPDSVVEPNEGFAIQLTNATGATLGTPSVASVTIQNDDTAPDISPEQTSIDFGDQQVGAQSDDRSFRVVNIGNANLNITAITSDNPTEFVIVSPPPPNRVVTGFGGATFIDVLFTPSTTGTRSAIITVESNDPDEPSITLNVSGNGVLSVTYVVNQAGKNGDTGDGVCDATCTLRDAIDAANAGPVFDTITFDPAVFQNNATITLLGEQLTIATDMSITGTGAKNMTVSGNNASRVFSVADTAGNVSISGMRIAGGSAEVHGDGGGIHISGATVTLDGIWITSGSTAGSGCGGGIYNGGTTTLTNSAIDSNTSARHGGGICNEGNLTAANITVSGNTAADNGGGIYQDGSLALSGSTVAFNTAASGSGIFAFDGTATVANSIVAANVNNAVVPDINGAFSSGGFNMIGNATGSTGFVNGANGDQVGGIVNPAAPEGAFIIVDPKLRPLGDVGGPVPTHAFNNAGGISPAIDKGNAFGATLDARGFPRTVDLPLITNAFDGTDIGAFELQAPTAAAVTVSGFVRTSGGLPIRNASVTIFDGDLNEPVTVVTGAFGIFSFTGLRAGQTYFVMVSAGRYAFAEPVRTVVLVDNVDDLDFVAN